MRQLPQGGPSRTETNTTIILAEMEDALLKSEIPRSDGNTEDEPASLPSMCAALVGEVASLKCAQHKERKGLIQIENQAK